MHRHSHADLATYGPANALTPQQLKELLGHLGQLAGDGIAWGSPAQLAQHLQSTGRWETQAEMGLLDAMANFQHASVALYEALKEHAAENTARWPAAAK